MDKIGISSNDIYDIVYIVIGIFSLITIIKQSIIKPITQRSDERHNEIMEGYKNVLNTLKSLNDKFDDHQDRLVSQHERINQLRRETNDHENRLRKIENVDQFPIDLESDEEKSDKE